MTEEITGRIQKDESPEFSCGLGVVVVVVVVASIVTIIAHILVYIPDIVIVIVSAYFGLLSFSIKASF